MTSNQSASMTSAQKRLLKDYAEVQREPLPMIAASPTPKSLFVWYANILAPETSRYHGIILHLKMEFPNNYPHSPPAVHLFTRIPHSHVFNGLICLDMLETHSSAEPYHGWSSAYSVQSILSQLQCFLLEEEDFQTNRDIRSCIEHSRKLYREDRAYGVIHDPPGGHPWPWRADWPLPFGEAKPAIVQPVQEIIEPCKKTNHIPLEIVLSICSFLELRDIRSIQHVNTVFHEACNDPSLVVGRELVCFHSKTTWLEDIIGIGINVTWQKKQKKLHEVSSPLDLVSYNAFFQEYLGKAAWGETFEYWLPLYLSPSNAQKAIPEFERFVRVLNKQEPSPSMLVNLQSTATPEMNPAFALDLMANMMNFTVSQIMKGQMHASLRALRGYCYAHRWMLYLVQRYPDLLVELNKVVERFLYDDEYRSKDACPNIGVLFSLLSISDYTWDQVKEVVITETLTRNAFWITKEYPFLANVHNDKRSQNERNRVAYSFTKSEVGLKLSMFNVFFLNKVVGSERNIDKLCEVYDNRLGAPSPELEIGLQDAIFEIMNTTNYEQFLKYVGWDKHDPDTIYQLLCTCMKSSERKGYHKNYSQSGSSGRDNRSHDKNKRRRNY